jgi:large repetitive protein
MKKILFSLLSFILVSVSSMAQVAINNDGSVPNTSAMLDVKSTSMGMLVPRLTTVQRDAILSPATGLLVFNTSTGAFDYYTGTAWLKLGSSPSAGTNIGDMLVWDGSQWQPSTYLHYYADKDNDGLGDLYSQTFATSQPYGFVSNDCDADDNDGSSGGGTPYLRFPDADGDGYGDPTRTPIYSCWIQPGYAIFLQDDCDDSNAQVYPDAPEYCDGLDNNCNGQVDEKSTLYRDSDNDGYGDLNNSILSCYPFPPGYLMSSGDCNDQDFYTNPGIPFEACDGIDNNCDGQIDEGSTYIFSDYDNDGFGTMYSNYMEWPCGDPVPPGYASSFSDCDDYNSGINPDATEICDGLDNDCNGQIDDNVSTFNTFYADTDADGFGDPDNTTTAIGCIPPNGYVNNQLDCDDNNPVIHPGMPESCNGVDDDCNGLVDEGITADGFAYYMDYDGDGYGDEGYIVLLCYAQPGYSLIAGDCADYDPAIHPGATEICSNGIDDNCDGQIDESGCQ